MSTHKQSYWVTLLHTSACFILFISISSASIAQTYQAGFLISQSGDRLDGFILFKDHAYNRQKCSFKPTLDGKAQDFSPSEIQAYEIEGVAAFRSAGNTSISSDEVFLEYILRGTPSLLYYGNSYFVESEGELEELIYSVGTIERDGKTFEKETETYKRQLIDYFKSCPDLSGEVLESRFNSKDLYKVFTAYYACEGTSPQSFISEGSLIKIKWGVGIKAQRNSLYANRLAGSTFYFETSDPLWKQFYSPYITIHLSYPRLNSQLALRSGIAFHRYAYENSEINDRAGVDLFYEMEIQASQIEIPVEIIFNLNKDQAKAFSPYVFAGAGMNFLISLEGDRNTTTLTGIPLSRNVFSGRSSSFMLRGGLGTTLSIGNSLSLFTELFVENSNGFAVPDDNDVLIFRKALGLSIGVYFE